MADYTAITTLSALDETIPSSNEVVNKLDDAMRQTRGFLKVFLGVVLDEVSAVHPTRLSCTPGALLGPFCVGQLLQALLHILRPAEVSLFQQLPLR